MTTDTFNLIKITGEDSKKFLQTQITADIKELDNTDNTDNSENKNSKILSVYCNQKGRVISVFYILKPADNNYYIVTLGDTAEVLTKKIKKYAIFSKITFEILEAYQEQDIFKQYNISNQLSYYIDNKIPIIDTQNSEEFLPDNLNLIGLGAVNFKKGCFLGQEIIARVFYKGKTKKKLYKITSDNSLSDNSPEIITHNNEPAGTVIIANNNTALAVIDDLFIQEELYIDNNKISIEV